MWLESNELSGWCYHYCKYIKDKPEIRKLITESVGAYHYCFNIKDDPEVRK